MSFPEPFTGYILVRTCLIFSGSGGFDIKVKCMSFTVHIVIATATMKTTVISHHYILTSLGNSMSSSRSPLPAIYHYLYSSVCMYYCL